VNPIEAVSPTIVRTLSAGICSVSATIIPMEARDPPISGLPDTATTVPSSATCTAALDSPPMLNQNPQATPRPCPGFSGDFQCAVFFAASSVARNPMFW
jgi:hypothetical protein